MRPMVSLMAFPTWSPLSCFSDTLRAFGMRAPQQAGSAARNLRVNFGPLQLPCSDGLVNWSFRVVIGGHVMAFFGLFRSRAERDQGGRAEEAELTRAHDMGRQMTQTVTQLIDTFFDEKVRPVVINVNKALVHDLEAHHHDKTTDGLMSLLVDYEDRLKGLKQAAVDGIWESLGEWKYQLIRVGVKDDFDRYIAHKLDPIWETLSKHATEQGAYCAARITGHITDETHAMTPDELKEYVQRRKT